MSNSIFRHAHSFLLLPALLPILLSLENPLTAVPRTSSGAFPESSRLELNQPPVAVNDSIQVHGGTQLNIMANDSDPDNDDIFFDRFEALPQHGNVSGSSSSTPFYVPNSGYVGSDTFTYRIQDSNGAFSSFAMVTLDVRNNAPITGSHSFKVHGLTFFGTLTDLTATDRDPDGDPMLFDSIQTHPEHGTLTTLFHFFPGYTPNPGYTGADSFTYKICDDLGLCAIAAVTLDVRNNAPVGGTRVYTAHGLTMFGTLNDLMATDSDPDGDPISFDSIQTNPEHGTLTTQFQQFPGYTPDLGYTGRDSFTYRICDNLGLCAPNVVSINVVNTAPTPGRHEYGVRGLTLFGTLNALMKGDSDPDGDPISFDSIQTFPQHGSLTNAFLQFPGYTPAPGFAGTDSFTYKVCDHLGKCAIATVTLYATAEGENNGTTSCNLSVGSPINVSDGNMYLQQGDYQLPSVGFGINVARTYNSNSQRVGLFGRGWSTEFDDSIAAYDASLLRFNQSDGRAVYFGRPLDSSDVFKDLVGDFHAQVSQNTGDFTLTAKDGSTERFNTAGKLLSVTDRNGNTTSLSYDGNGFLSSVTDPFSRVLTVNTNANGRVTSISDPMGTVATYTYGNSDELLSVTYADNSTFNFAYDQDFRLITVSDALGNVVESHTYDTAGRAVTSERQGGVEHYSLSYVSDNETHVTDALGHVTKYTFDKSKGRNVVTRVEGVCGCGGGAQVQTWTYDNQLNVASKTDALGHVTSYTYDGNGDLLTEADPTGTVTYTYNEFAEVLTRTDQLNFVSANTYDGLGNLVSTTDARGKITNFVNDSRGLLLSVTDARGKATRFAYDSAGNLITRTDALSHDTTFAYDARGRLTSMTNALGHVTALSYDGFGRLNKITQADGTTVTYEYDLAGRRTAMTNAKGSRSTFAYDAASRLTSQTDALNQAISFGYDVMSNLTSVTDPISRSTNYEYDDFNRPVKIIYPPAAAGATRLFDAVAYDAGGNVTQRTDSAGRVTAYTYDNVNRVVSTTDADNQTTSFEYDALSRFTALVDAIGQRYRFNYNAMGMVTHARRGTDVMSFSYDAVGNRRTRTDYNGAVTEYDYDALSRLKTISYPDTTTVGYTYDKVSRLQTATNENGTLNFDYNKMNRVVRATDVFGQVIEYNYDDNGNRTRLSLNSALVETYRYDALDRLTKILDAAGAAFTFDYDAVNKLTQKKAPNGVKTTYQYDGLDRLTRLLDAKGVNTIADRQYQYNNASQITQIAEPAITKNYGYDPVDRLTAASYTNPLQPNENYSYDGVGNRTTSQLSASHTYQRFNRLTTTSSASYAYDSNGNLVSKTEAAGITQYIWDFENRLRQVALPNGTTVSYKYDALGRRIQRAPSTGVSTNFIYDGQDVVKDLNSDGSTVDYLNGLGVDNKLRLTDSRLIATGPLYFLHDHLGSTTGFTNSLGTVVSSISYDSFGNPGAGASLTRYTYTGREYDSETGLFYYRARWYDPKVGRFVSEDPIGFAGGINQFAYVDGDPQNRTDPSGLYDIDVHYYLTYYLAIHTGCFSDWEARQIAEGNQHSDQDDDKKPGLGYMIIAGLPPIPDAAQQRRNANFHAFGTPEQNNLRAMVLYKYATQGSGNPWAFGTYLHFFQDSNSHREFAGNTGVGQTKRGNSPDHTNNNIGRSLDMAFGTFEQLKRFGRFRGCECDGDVDWKRVEEFIRVGFGSGQFDRTRDFFSGVSDDQLRLKIGILGVPWRSTTGR